MDFDEIIGILILLFCTGFGAILLWKFFDIIRKSIRKNNASYDEHKFDRLAKAFIQYRKDTDRRLQNMEAILTKKEEANNQLNQQRGTQTIETSDFKPIQRRNVSKTEHKQNTT